MDYVKSRGWEGERPLIETPNQCPEGGPAEFIRFPRWEGDELVALVHRTAAWKGAVLKHYCIVNAEAQIGADSIVWYWSQIGRGAVLGERCIVGPCSYVGPGAVLGHDVRIQHAAHITDRMRVGNRVFVGNGVMTTNDKRPVVGNSLYKAEPPMIEDDASIGAGAVILPGVRIGRGAIVGAGAVVTKDVPDGVTVVGNPARVLVKESAPNLPRSLYLTPEQVDRAHPKDPMRPLGSRKDDFAPFVPE